MKLRQVWSIVYEKTNEQHFLPSELTILTDNAILTFRMKPQSKPLHTKENQAMVGCTKKCILAAIFLKGILLICHDDLDGKQPNRL